jgi:hypothetical protein
MDSSVMVNGSLPKSAPQLRVGAERLSNCRYLFVQNRRQPLDSSAQNAGTGIRSNFR